jgi:hypothetical protein
VLRQRRVDGLILSLQSEASADTIKALHSVQVPIVLLDRELAGFPADAVLFDHASGVRQAVEALLAWVTVKSGCSSGRPIHELHGTVSAASLSPAKMPVPMRAGTTSFNSALSPPMPWAGPLRRSSTIHSPTPHLSLVMLS